MSLIQTQVSPEEMAVLEAHRQQKQGATETPQSKEKAKTKIEIAAEFNRFLAKATAEARKAAVAMLYRDDPELYRLMSAPMQYLDDAELNRLFRAVRAGKSVRDMAIFEVAYHRGLRASEVGLLRLSDLDLTRQTLFCRAVKSGDSGEALLTERELKALRPWLELRGLAEGALFPSRKKIMGPGGLRGIERTQLHRMMHRYAEEAGMPSMKRHFHCLRHSCAIQLLDLGVDIQEIQHHLRHKRIGNTVIYAETLDERRRLTAEIQHHLRHKKSVTPFIYVENIDKRCRRTAERLFFEW